jgi:membrane-associated phospholipid phosphatase
MWTSLVSVVVLTFLVVGGVVQPLDVRLRWLFRPHDVWGPTQWNADLVVEGLRPSHMLLLVCCVTVLVGLTRRAWAPILVGTAALLPAVIAVTGIQKLVSRPDPHDGVASASYPSGHTMSIMIAVGLSILLLAGTRAAAWALGGAAMAGLAMGYALLVQAAHWASDVLGGALIAVTVLAWVGHSPWFARRLDPVQSGETHQRPAVTAASTPSGPARSPSDQVGRRRWSTPLRPRGRWRSHP